METLSKIEKELEGNEERLNELRTVIDEIVSDIERK
jgi:hypothetical protein